jgi:hypothetical protein
MRRFSLGCLRYSPARFGKMMVGDFLDAMIGYNEGESERIKALAELIRMSTAIQVNIQLERRDKVTAHDLWPFPWDKEPSHKIEIITEEEKKKREDAMLKVLNKIMPDPIKNGNSNIKP